MEAYGDADNDVTVMVGSIGVNVEEEGDDEMGTVDDDDEGDGTL